jgi:hypothetical protein
MKLANEMKTLMLGLSVLSILLSASVVVAQEDAPADDPAESTIRLMGAAEAALPDAVTKDIKLPPALGINEKAVENASRGLTRANENRERREQGLGKADEAREKGNEISEQARENRENRGRFDDPPGRPDEPPGKPDRPRGPPK